MKSTTDDSFLKKSTEITNAGDHFIAQNLPCMAWIANRDGSVTYCNSRWLEYTGQSFEEARGLGWATALHTEDRAEAASEWKLALSRQQAFESHVRLRSSATGAFRWFLIRMGPIADESDKLGKWIAIFTDVHDLKTLQDTVDLGQADILEAKRVAEAASAAKSVFLANMSHEIRTPLAAIIGHSGFLLDPEHRGSEYLNSIHAIKRNSEHLAKLVDEVLDLSKIEAGHLEIELMSFDLKDIIEYVSAVAEFKAREKGISFKISVDPSVPEVVRTDPTRLRQILLNIVGNAVKFTERGGVEVKVECHKNPQDEKQTLLRFCVIDTGIGIPNGDEKKLFAPFVQSDSTTSRRFGGTGLGLALSKKLANALGGEVGIAKSSTGSGTTFQIDVGIEVVSQASMNEIDNALAQRTEEILAAKKDSLLGVNILVVDDSSDNRYLMQIMLRPTGANIRMAQDGNECVEQAFAHDDLDLILLDIQMPVMDGYEAIKVLRDKGFRKPVIALTAHALKEDRERSFQSGFDDHLTKPVNKEALLSVIAHYAARVEDTRRRGSVGLSES